MLNNERLKAMEVDYQYEQPEMFSLDDYELDEGALSQAEARLRSENAKRALGTMDQLPEWYEEYLRILDGGRPWRVAAYIAWASVPKTRRWPKTQKELASEVLGLTSDRQIIKWRKNDSTIMDMVSSLQMVLLLEHRADVLQALINSAVDPDYKSHNDRKLFLEITGDYVPSSKIDAVLNRAVTALEYKSDEQLARESGYSDNAK